MLSKKQLEVCTQMMKSSEQRTQHSLRRRPLSLSLSPIDTDPNLNITFRFLRAYTATTTHHHPFHHCHREHPDCGIELWCATGQGIPLIQTTVDFTRDSVNYLDDPSSPIIEQMVPNPEPVEAMEHPCMLQLTVFKCGRFTLGPAVHHSLCDRLGATQFFNAVGELARGLPQITVEPIWDQERLLGPRNPRRVDSSLIGEFLYLDKGFSPSKEVVGGVVRQCFHVRDESLDKFKRSLYI